MKLARVETGSAGPPFPIHDDLVARLLAAHTRPPIEQRDETVAHVLGTCAGYAYADTDTVAMIMGRLGLERGACVSITQVVDTMFIASTAFVVQSQCGRVVIVCYRGTEPANVGSWLGDADVGPEVITHAGEEFAVHAGFYRNVRATRWPLLAELTRALEGRSLLDPARTLDYPLQALYVTGHSLGGAMAVLFALALKGSADQHDLAERLRAVYTYGQPMTLVEPIPRAAQQLGGTVFRHILPRDVVPTLPPVGWGRFAHVGQEYAYVDGAWRRAKTPVAQLRHVREIPRLLLGYLATPKRAAAARFAAADHGPQHYIAALRPAARITEFGDYE